MKTLTDSIRRAVKVWLLTAVVVIATLALAQDSASASEAGTEVFLSDSNANPSAASSVVLLIDGASQDMYVWAADVKDPTGLSAFEVDVAFDNTLVSVTSIVADPWWLSSTGRATDTDGDTVPDPYCSDPIIEPIFGDPVLWHANVSCATVGAPPQYPYGPRGSGHLATLTLVPGSQASQSSLTLTDGTLLVNTTQNPYPPIPATLRSTVVVIAPCADFDANGVVTIIDILIEASMYGLWPGHDDWDPMYDMDGNNIVNIPDILIVARQFGNYCWIVP